MNFKEWWNKISTEGLKLPYLYDPVTEKPSITLLFAYVTFVLAMITSIFLAIKDIVIGTVSAITFWIVAVIFYRLRQLDKVKFDLDDRSFELEGNENTDDDEKQT